MTTINTIEDLVRLLDEKPEWAEALRSRLQTRELTELPGKFESFRAEMHQAFADLAQSVQGLADALTATNDRLDKAEEDRRDLREVVGGLVDAQAETNRRLDKAEEERRDLRQTVGDLAQTVGDLAQTVKGLVDALTETNRRLDRVDGNVQELRSEFNGLRDDFGPVKAAHVRNAALREVADIARSIGCTLVKVLGPEEVYDLHRGKDTSGISSDQLKSFRYGDLIIEATDINGSTCYLAVEVSYTVDKRDTSRSVRNAQFLTLFTSRPAFAGVAGVRFDDEIASGSDGVFLYQVYARNLEVD
jgi:DNA repair exonuclease SbcCD ATPase subunit